MIKLISRKFNDEPYLEAVSWRIWVIDWMYFDRKLDIYTRSCGLAHETLAWRRWAFAATSILRLQKVDKVAIFPRDFYSIVLVFVPWIYTRCLENVCGSAHVYRESTPMR